MPTYDLSEGSVEAFENLSPLSENKSAELVYSITDENGELLHDITLRKSYFGQDEGASVLLFVSSQTDLSPLRPEIIPFSYPSIQESDGVFRLEIDVSKTQPKELREIYNVLKSNNILELPVQLIDEVQLLAGSRTYSEYEMQVHAKINDMLSHHQYSETIEYAVAAADNFPDKNEYGQSYGGSRCDFSLVLGRKISNISGENLVLLRMAYSAFETVSNNNSCYTLAQTEMADLATKMSEYCIEGSEDKRVLHAKCAYHMLNSENIETIESARANWLDSVWKATGKSDLARSILGKPSDYGGYSEDEFQDYMIVMKLFELANEQGKRIKQLENRLLAAEVRQHSPKVGW